MVAWNKLVDEDDDDHHARMSLGATFDFRISSN